MSTLYQIMRIFPLYFVIYQKENYILYQSFLLLVVLYAATSSFQIWKKIEKLDVLSGCEELTIRDFLDPTIQHMKEQQLDYPVFVTPHTLFKDVLNFLTTRKLRQIYICEDPVESRTRTIFLGVITHFDIISLIQSEFIESQVKEKTMRKKHSSLGHSKSKSGSTSSGETTRSVSPDRHLKSSNHSSNRSRTNSSDIKSSNLNCDNMDRISPKNSQGQTHTHDHKESNSSEHTLNRSSKSRHHSHGNQGRREKIWSVLLLRRILITDNLHLPWCYDPVEFHGTSKIIVPC